MFIPNCSFCASAPYRIGLPFTHKKGDFWREFCNEASAAPHHGHMALLLKPRVPRGQRRSSHVYLCFTKLYQIPKMAAFQS